jgi:hypothetical protein
MKLIRVISRYRSLQKYPLSSGVNPGKISLPWGARSLPPNGRSNRTHFGTHLSQLFSLKNWRNRNLGEITVRYFLIDGYPAWRSGDPRIIIAKTAILLKEIFARVPSTLLSSKSWSEQTALSEETMDASDHCNIKNTHCVTVWRIAHISAPLFHWFRAKRVGRELYIRGTL